MIGLKHDPIAWSQLPYTDFELYCDRLFTIYKEMEKAKESAANNKSSPNINNTLASSFRALTDNFD